MIDMSADSPTPSCEGRGNPCFSRPVSSTRQGSPPCGGRDTTAWMQEVGQRKEQLPREGVSSIYVILNNAIGNDFRLMPQV